VQCEMEPGPVTNVGPSLPSEGRINNLKVRFSTIQITQTSVNNSIKGIATFLLITSNFLK
jgi:hypothetical protein